MDPFLDKPEGMGCGTYNRLLLQAAGAMNVWSAGMYAELRRMDQRRHRMLKVLSPDL